MFSRSAASQKNSKLVQLDIPVIKPVVKGYISPNGLYLYVLKATSNNALTINLVDLRKQKHVSELKLVAKDLSAIEGWPVDDYIILAGVQGDKFISMVAINNKRKLVKIWDISVDLYLYKPFANSHLNYKSP